MRGVRILLAAAWLPLMCAAEEKCPWLNAATAAGVLSGTVTATVTQTTCEFIRRDGSIESALRVEVEAIGAPSAWASLVEQCRSDKVPLKAIGNEAIACTCTEKKGQTAEQVVGRVRNQAFLVRITTNSHTATSAAIREQTRKVAEQIAGYLF